MIQEAIKNILSKLDTMLEFDEGIDVNSVEELKSKYDTFVKENFPEAQEEKQLLLVDLCGRLPYGVKLLVEGWDSDRDCKFDTVETLIGIDDRFIYTIWDKTGDKDKHSIVEPLSILDYKPYLRPMSSMTEEEKNEYNKTFRAEPYASGIGFIYVESAESFDWLNAHHFDYRGLIEKGLAIKVIEENNPYKE